MITISDEKKELPKSPYYKPSLPRSLAEEIDVLFDKFPQYRRQYNDNRVTFIEEAVRLRLQQLSCINKTTSFLYLCESCKVVFEKNICPVCNNKTDKKFAYHSSKIHDE